MSREVINLVYRHERLDLKRSMLRSALVALLVAWSFMFLSAEEKVKWLRLTRIMDKWRKVFP